MPVHFAHGSGLDGDEGGGEAAGDGEGLGVEDLDGAAWDPVGLVEVSKVRMVGNEVFGHLVNCIWLETRAWFLTCCSDQWKL